MDALKQLGKKLGAGLLAIMLNNVAIADTITYFHNDISGSPMAATDAAGNLLWKENYKPYGDKLNRSAPSSSNKIGYHGKAYDDSTGLSYMGARYYDPVLGRFMGIDAVDFQEDNLHSFNRYTYANNNPYKYVDPDGNYAFLIAPLIALYTVLSASAILSSTNNGSGQAGADGFNSGGISSGSDIGNPNTWSTGRVHNEEVDTKDDSAIADGRIDHGNKRAQEAQTDSHRQVGDKNRVIEGGRHYVDNDTGHNVHVKGDRVVITDNRGNTVSQFKNSRANTNGRVASGKWTPSD
ncbi:RHS domain-containing protein [Pseudomonas bijieensis]|uniref:RHS repeat-associated core domain-containing protein n=1 Tax=Pseudomonas bijieensis TaxID=2681983 RepID=UPI00200BF759|nr:RHS repeat-associated core domain-containing protein [Pseudomonas bijieensis]UQI28480.1 RHS domain-containing protein [Pseudomonas bijieensis]